MIQQHGIYIWHVGKHKDKGDTEGKMKSVLVHSGDSNMVDACGM